MSGEKRPPRLRWRPSRPAHVCGNGRLTHRGFPTSGALRECEVRPTGGWPWTSRESMRRHRLERPAVPCDVGSSTSRTGGSRDDARRAPSLAARHGVPRAGPSLRQPRPQQTIDGGEAKSWTSGTIRNCQLVSKREDLQMQSCARTDQQPERVEDRNNDGHDGSSLFRAPHNLNRHKAYRVFGRHRLRGNISCGDGLGENEASIQKRGRSEAQRDDERLSGKGATRLQNHDL